MHLRNTYCKEKSKFSRVIPMQSPIILKCYVTDCIKILLNFYSCFLGHFSQNALEKHIGDQSFKSIPPFFKIFPLVERRATRRKQDSAIFDCISDFT